MTALRRRRRRIAVAAALLLAAYPLAAWIGSSIPTNPPARAPTDGVRLLIGSNGVHTIIVVPLIDGAFDWRGVFPAADLADPEAPYTHLAISWGQREVFLETPTWWDLRPRTVLEVILGGGDALLHVNHFVRPAADDSFRPLIVSRAQYRVIAGRILLARAPGGRRHAGYGPSDVFYDSVGRYTLLRTCNEWTGATLRKAGVRVGRWTPFAGGVMKWIPDAEP